MSILQPGEVDPSLTGHHACWANSPCRNVGVPDIALMFPTCFTLGPIGMVPAETRSPGGIVVPLQGQSHRVGAFIVTRWPGEAHYAAAACEAWFDEVGNGFPRGSSKPLQVCIHGIIEHTRKENSTMPAGLTLVMCIVNANFARVYERVCNEIAAGGSPGDERIAQLIKAEGPAAPEIEVWLEKQFASRGVKAVAPSQS